MNKFQETHISLDEMSKLIGVTKHTLRQWDKEGKLTARRTAGGHRYYTHEDFNRYVNPKESLDESLSEIATVVPDQSAKHVVTQLSKDRKIIHLSYSGKRLIDYDFEYDASEGFINPLEMFGNTEDVHQVYAQGIDRLVEMVKVMLKEWVEDNGIDEKYIRDAINSFYLTQRLTTQDEYRFKEMAKFINVVNKNIYPLFNSLIHHIYVYLTASDTPVGTRKTTYFNEQLKKYKDILNYHTNPEVIKRLMIEDYIMLDFSGQQKDIRIQHLHLLNILRYIQHLVSVGGYTIIISDYPNEIDNTSEIIKMLNSMSDYHDTYIVVTR